MEIWIVGQYISGISPDIVWELQGVFSTKENAIRACIDDAYFTFPVELDKEYPKETIIIRDTEFPKLKGDD